MSGFNAAQTAQLLRPIAPARVLKDGKGHSHVSQQDITAHLIRVFGFGGFDTQVLNVECVFETPRVDDKGVPTGRWDVCYRALLRLSVMGDHGMPVCHYEDGSTATAQNQTRGDAHDLAYKSALSLAKKRAAINLGDQFGLSLYNKGQMNALVKGTLVSPGPTVEADPADVQDGVEQQVSLGNDEIDMGDEIPFDPTPFEQQITSAATSIELAKIGEGIAKAAMPDDARKALRRMYAERITELQPARTS